MACTPNQSSNIPSALSAKKASDPISTIEKKISSQAPTSEASRMTSNTGSCRSRRSHPL